MEEFYGYIEGYFGKTLSWEQRFLMVDHLASLGMNSFILAPKEDPFHRVEWRKPYPSEILSKIVELTAYGKTKGVKVIPAMAPGLSFDYLNDEDYQHLFYKMKTFAEKGISSIGLFMDDIAFDLPENCTESFSSLGEAHALLLERLKKDLKKVNNNETLWFCPTIYTDEFVEEEAADSLYLRDLAAKIPQNIPLLWTGNKVVAPTITKENIQRVSDLFNGNIIIWDNYYANDYCTRKIILGPLLGREPKIKEKIKGLLLNPTGLFYTDKFLLTQLGDFMNKGYSNEETWLIRAKEYEIPEIFIKIKEYFWSPFGTRETPKDEIFTLAGDFYHKFIVLWQNPLKLEWFPYLYGFSLDIQYLYKKKTATLDQAWLDNNFPPIPAAELGRSLSQRKRQLKTLTVNTDVLLKEITTSNAADIFKTIDSQREYLGRWLPFVAFTQKVEDSEAFVHSVTSIPDEDREYVFCIFYKNEFAGLAGFRSTDKGNGKTEIGYWLSKDFQKKGIMIQSVKILCQFAFEELDMNKITIQCAVENKASRKIPESLGFHQDGIERDAEKLSDGKFTDAVIYSLLAKEKNSIG